MPQAFKFNTRFRVLPKNFGVYDGEKVIDVEEIVVGTDTLRFEDYITARKYPLTSSVFWNDSWFDAPVNFVRAFGVKASEWWEAMLPAMENGPANVKQFLEDFVRETRNELFPTRQSCIDFYSHDENFEKLKNGEIGDNLMYKYRAIASFHIWREMCATAMRATRQIAVDRGIAELIPNFDEFWSDFSKYVELKHADGRTRDEIVTARSAEFSYDIGTWLAREDYKNVSAYRLDEPAVFEFKLSDESSRELEAALKVWTIELKGLTKMVTRINVAWQIRDCVPAGQPESAAA